MSLKFYEGPKDPYPRPVIYGYLEVIGQALCAGQRVSLTTRADLAVLRQSELDIALNPDPKDETHPETPVIQSTLDNALYNLGRMAAIEAMLDEPGRASPGFSR